MFFEYRNKLLNGVVRDTTKTDCHTKNTTKLDKGLKAPNKKSVFAPGHATSRKLLSRIKSWCGCYKLETKEPKIQGGAMSLRALDLS